jgi:peptide/nickel transport system substrate-binding protein
MTKKRHVLGRTLHAFLAAAVLIISWSGPRAIAAEKDQLVIGITQFPSTFNPNIDSMLAKTYVLSMTERPFTVYDAKWNLICMLCTELPTIENGRAKIETMPDGKKGIAVTYTIRPDAMWGDGVPVTTKDVMFTWEVGKNSKTGVSNAELYRRIKKIDVIDDKTFTMHFDKLTFDYNAINDFRLLPAHLDASVFTANPENYKNRTAFDTDTTNPGLYFGPYRVTEVVANSHVVLEPNPTWWGEKPKFKRIVVRVIGNTAALEANLLSGELDMIAGELGVTVDQALAFEKRHGQQYNVVFKPGLIYEHIDFNLDNPILKDKRVRQALILSLDRKAISDKLFEGRQPVADTNVNPLDWVHTDDTAKYTLDRDRAAALFDEAGWNVIKDGIRYNAKGEKLSFELMTTSGNRTRELVEQVLQSQWRQVGVDIRIRNQPARVFFGETVTQRKFTGMAMYAWYSAPENVPRTTLYSDQIPTAKNNFAGQNYTGFKNRTADELIDEIEVELNRDKRARLWHRLQQIYADELPAIPLYFRADAYILPKWLTGVHPTGHEGTTTLWVEHWGVKG